MHVTDEPSPRVEQLPRNIIYIDAPHCARVSSFRFFHQHYVTAVPPFSFPATDPVRLYLVRFGPVQSACPCCKERGCIARRALLLHVLRAKPGEHSFAEEAKVANYRVASREGGLMQSPMTGHIQFPFLLLPVDDARRRFHVGVKEHRPLRKSHYQRVRLRLSSPHFHPVFSVLKLSPSLLLSASTGSSSASFFFSSGHHRSSLTIRTVPNLVRSEERSDPGDRRVVTVIPQKDSNARLLSSTWLSSILFLFPSLSFSFPLRLSFCFLIALIRTVSLCPRISDE